MRKDQTDAAAKPSIEQLQAILQEDNLVVTINPDGSIKASARPIVHDLETLLSETRRAPSSY